MNLKATYIFTDHYDKNSSNMLMLIKILKGIFEMLYVPSGNQLPNSPLGRLSNDQGYVPGAFPINMQRHDYVELGNKS